jgi:hypothetical protein
VRFLALHDHLNQTQEVEVRADGIISITPFGSGSAISLQDAPIVCVRETPAEIAEMLTD